MKKIFGIGAVVLLILTQLPALAINTGTDTIKSPIISTAEQDISSNRINIDIDEIPDIATISGEEQIIWENKEASGIYDVASITVQIESVDDLIQGLEFPIQPLASSYYKFYTVSAKNMFGWTMFKLVAKGLFFASGSKMVFVLPSSYAKVEWWCEWAWSVEYCDQWPYVCDSYGKVNAEAGFSYFIGGTTELWAYIKCYPNGYAVGGGGEL